MSTKDNKLAKSVIALLIAVLLFFLGLLTAHVTETGGGTLAVNRLSIMTDDNALLSAKMFRPKDATVENRAPAVIVVPGGNANLEYMSSVSLELARRGYVTMAIDPYTIGRSDVINPTRDLGAKSALAYVKELDFVDTANIGMIGWSAGVGRINAAAILEDGTIDGVKALFGFGAGAPGDTELAVNQGYFIGRIDTTYGRGTSSVRDINTAEAFTKGSQTDYVEFGTWYGDLANNKGRILYSGPTGHILGLVSLSGVSAACNFFNDALTAQPNKEVSNYVFGWKEIGTAIAMIALIIAMILLCNILLKTKIFESLHKSEVNVIVADPKNVMMWVMLAVSVVFGALITKWAVYEGQLFLNKTVFLQIANVNGFIFWLLCLSVFALILLIVRAFVDKKVDKSKLKANAKTSVLNFAKALLLGLTVILCGYFLVSLGDQLLNLSPRFWKVQLNILNSKRLGLWLIYLPFFMIPMLISNYMQTTSYFTKNNPRLFTTLVWAANSLPALFFVLYVYGSIIIGGLTPITNAAMSRANGTMLDALILLIPVSFITSFFYRKTKNFYVSALLNAMIFAWAAVGTDLITFVG